MNAKNTQDHKAKNLNKNDFDSAYYLDLPPKHLEELEVAQTQATTGSFITMHDFDKKVKLWLNEK